MTQTTSSQAPVAKDVAALAPGISERGPLWIFGGTIAILTWLGWAAFAPAVGFPALAPAVMLNRALHVGLGSRWGWGALVLSLGLVASAYALAVNDGLVPRGVRWGLLMGAGAWLIAGAIVMPMLALATPDSVEIQLGGSDPIAGMAIPTDPDAMRPTFMMMHLGILAPVGALVGWLMFGGVLGATSRLAEPSHVVVEEGARRSRRGWGIVGAAALLALLAGIIWVIGHPTEAQALSCGPQAGLKIVDAVVGDVDVTAHGTVCVIEGTVTGDVTVRDFADACTKRKVLTAINVVGGTVEGDIHAEGRRCVMVWLRDGAHVQGNILYEAKGNLGFLGEDVGASVEGDVVSRGGQLWATGASKTNRIGGDLICDGALPAGGSGSQTDWDGFDEDRDGAVGGVYRC